MPCLLQKVIKTQKFGIYRPLQALLLLIKLDNFAFVFLDDIVHIDMKERSLRSSRHSSLRLPPRSSLALSLIGNPDRKGMLVIGIIRPLFRPMSRPLFHRCRRRQHRLTKHIELFLRLIDQIHPLNITVKFLNQRINIMFNEFGLAQEIKKRVEDLEWIAV
jgi:hypothetical protein